ncbi:MAG: DUF1211 domain-containing protein [Chitinophagaceae bacterium]|nr:MAG: DUF1211 domain-containing protein [Chitinophagaceae bacterium]
MSTKPNALLPGASKRLEALSDGVFAIAATILVLEIRVPELPKDFTKAELWHSMKEILPSFIAFVFSFLNILVFWVNHDAIGKVIRHYDYKTTYLNILFLLFISLIPFTTAFISKYPFSFTAITCYGAVLLLGSVVAIVMYDHIAFKAKLMLHAVTMDSRKRIRKRAVMGPPLYAVAIALGLIHVYIPIVIYAVTPVVFMFLPELDFEDEET